MSGFRFSVVFVSFASLALLAGVCSAAGQDGDFPEPNKNTKVNLKGTREDLTAFDSVAIGDKGIIEFGMDQPEVGAEEYRLLSFMINLKGKGKKAKTLLDGLKGPVVGAKAVLTGGLSAGAPKQAVGLLFYAGFADDWRETVILWVLPFDEKGRKAGAPRELLRYDISGAGQKLTEASVGAAVGADGVGVAVCFVAEDLRNWPAWYPSSAIYFLETDAAGKRKAPAARVTLEGGGLRTSAQAADPAWTGTGWLGAFSAVEFAAAAPAATGDPKATGHSLWGFAADLEAGKLVLTGPTVVARDSQEVGERAFAGVRFLEPIEGFVEPGAAARQLFYQHRAFVGEKKKTAADPRDFHATYNAQGLDGSGEPFGEAVKIPVPDWQPESDYTKGDKTYTDELVSNVLTTGDGKYVWATVNCFAIEKDGSPPYVNFISAMISEFEINAGKYLRSSYYRGMPAHLRLEFIKLYDTMKAKLITVHGFDADEVSAALEWFFMGWFGIEWGKFTNE
jgi:hypothetical protein